MGNDNLPVVSKETGRAMAESSVARAREAYERFAEAGEMALNAFEASAAQSFEGWRAVMGSSRETAHNLADRHAAGARTLREQWDDAGARLYNAVEDNAVHTMAAMREISHRMLVARTRMSVRASISRTALPRQPMPARSWR